MPKKLPYGMSNFADLIERNYAYVDKTRYVEFLENENNAYQFFIRPRRFGKSLFLSMLENYYDLNKKDKFNSIFGNLCIGKNPTPEQGTYAIMLFDFSSLDTDNYESLKAGTKSVVKRIFITGITPIMINDLTSGFNMADDLTIDPRYNEMLGFTREEVEWIMQETGVDKNLIKIDMESYYNGYMFSEDAENKVYNSQMTLYLFNQILKLGKQPPNIVDVNLRTDYGRLRRLAGNEKNRETYLQITRDGGIFGNRAIRKFSLEELHHEENFISLLFYLGMLTNGGMTKGQIFWKIPNYSIKTLWDDIVSYIRDLDLKKTQIDTKKVEIDAITQKIVVTGATGMIGASIVRCALEKGADVLCIVRKGSERLDNLPKSERLKVIFAAQNEYVDLDISGDYDVFYHLAWDKTFGASRDDVDTQVLNIQYTLDAVRLAKRLGCKKFVGTGSQAEYGLVDRPMTPATPCFPLSGYGVAKHAAGLLAKLCCRQLEMQFNWVRILSVFGPLDGVHTLIMYTINELRAGRSPEFTKCEQIWDYLYCDDAARALLAIGENGITGKIYPLGAGNGKKLSDYLESIRNIIAPGATLQFGKKNYYPHQPMYLCADIFELTADTGWKPEVSFEEGIKRINEIL